MSEPEQLDIGPMRPPRRMIWVVTVALLAVLGAGVMWDQRRSDQTAPAPTPSPTQAASRSLPTAPPASRAPSPSAPATLWPEQAGGGARLLPAGLPAGTLYGRSSDTLYAVNTRTGATVVTPIRTATTDAVSMVSTGDGLVLRPWDDTAGLLIRDGRMPVDLPGQLKGAADLLPGPPDRLWALSRADDYLSFDTTVTLVDFRGRRAGPRFNTSGGYTSDGAGGLLLSDVGGVWQAYPQPIERITGGSITSVGSHHYWLLECDDQHRCTQYLLDRRNNQRTSLPAHERVFGNSSISPDGILMASLDNFDNNARSRTTITRMADNKVLRKLPEPPNPATSEPGSIAWLSDRWLTVISNSRLTFYDATNNRAVTPDLPAHNLLQLTWRPG